MVQIIGSFLYNASFDHNDTKHVSIIQIMTVNLTYLEGQFKQCVLIDILTFLMDISADNKFST